jgi:triacylglycerol lipase
MDGMRDDIARLIAAHGPVLTQEMVVATLSAYAPLHEAEPYGNVAVTRDIAYGKHERQRLDVFAPPGTAPKPRPVVLFVHGGGFVGGDKRLGAGPYYDNAGLWAVRSGFVGITMAYRLAPGAAYPAAAADIGAALRWALANIATFGGDPAGIVLLGQSAGATHVATYAALTAVHARPGGGVRGAIMLSGIFDFSAFGGLANADAYSGSDPEARVRASALPALALTGIPLLFTVAEHDPPAFHEQAELLARALEARHGEPAPLVRLPRHNHVSPIAELNAADDGDGLLHATLTEFIRTRTVHHR